MTISGGSNARSLPMPAETNSFFPPISYTPLVYLGKNLRSGESIPIPKRRTAPPCTCPLKV